MKQNLTYLADGFCK